MAVILLKKLLAGALAVGMAIVYAAVFQSACAMKANEPYADISAAESVVAAAEADKAGTPLDEMGIETGKIYKDIYFQGAGGKLIDMPCWVWIPKGATTNMPLTVFMHGSEQTRSKKNLSMDSRSPKSSLPLLIRDEVIPLDSLNTILIAPHRFADTYGRKEYINVIESAIQYYGSDTSRIALTGFSWGGAMTYDLVAMRPDLFCVVFIASSGPRGNPGTLRILRNLTEDSLPPIITMITKTDRDFPYSDVIKALKPLGDKVEIITVKGGHYESAYSSYADPSVQELLFLTGNPLYQSASASSQPSVPSD